MIPVVLACDDIESNTEESEHDMGVPMMPVVMGMRGWPLLDN